MRKYLIYKLECKNQEECEEIYVGSTYNWNKRVEKHRATSKYPHKEGHNQLKYQIIRENGGWENWNMICIEECDETIQTDKEASKIEEKWRKELDAKMNMKKAHRTKEDLQEYQKNYTEKWRKDNADYKKEKDKEYREKNEAKIKAHKAEKHNCPCGGKYTNCHKREHEKSGKHKKWLEAQECE